MQFTCNTYQRPRFLFHNSDTTRPGDLLSYAGLVLCIVLTIASLSFSPTLRLNATIELLRQFEWLLQDNPIPKSTWLLSQLEIHPQFLHNAQRLHESYCFSCPESRVLVSRPLQLPQCVVFPHHLCYLQKRKNEVARDYWHCSVILGLSSVVVTS